MGCGTWQGVGAAYYSRTRKSYTTCAWPRQLHQQPDPALPPTPKGIVAPKGRVTAMSDSHSDALVFFGATGDLAYKKIFPALQAMLKRGHLNVPVIGVAKAGWNLDQLRARAQDGLSKHGGMDAAAFEKIGRASCR